MRSPAKNECGRKKQQKICSARNFDWITRGPWSSGSSGSSNSSTWESGAPRLSSGLVPNSILFHFLFLVPLDKPTATITERNIVLLFYRALESGVLFRAKLPDLEGQDVGCSLPTLAESTLYWLDLVVRSDGLEKSLGPRWRVSWALFGATLGPAISTNWSSSCPSTLTHCTDTTRILSWTPPWKP